MEIGVIVAVALVAANAFFVGAEFAIARLRPVMQPRAAIDYVITSATPDDAIEAAMRTGRTRLPLVEHEGDLDGAVGVINAKDLLPAALGEGIDLRELARPLPRIADGTRVDQVLRDMRRGRRHVALVVDEHGTVIGLLTLEDVLEELVGEIDDEFDTAAEQLIQRADGEIRIDGAAPLRLVARELGLTIDAPHETTVNGHLIESLGRVPQAGETVELDGARLEVLAGDASQVSQLRVRGA
jgi:CBS domain containing-hemolysin-like protein